MVHGRQSPRLASINSRFGYAVADRILRKLSEEMRRGLSANRITAQKETLVEIGNREIFPPPTAWAVSISTSRHALSARKSTGLSRPGPQHIAVATATQGTCTWAPR
jgi:hypothetical protein